MTAMHNKFPGNCSCGAQVAAGAGTVSKRGSKWVISCASCSGCAAKPAAVNVEHDSIIEAPSGRGYAPCSTAYREAMEARADARAAGDETAEWRADCRIEELRRAGHLGKFVTHDYDQYAAFAGCSIAGNGLLIDGGRPVQGNPNTRAA